jgi:hypothetical protein
MTWPDVAIIISIWMATAVSVIFSNTNDGFVYATGATIAYVFLK